MNKITTFLMARGTIKRTPFFLTGFILFAIKYNLDRFISYRFFRRYWSIINYFMGSDAMLMQQVQKADSNFYYTLALTAVPFILYGTILTVKRLRDAALPSWMVVFFFLPFINLVFFGLISVIPSKQPVGNKEHEAKNSFLDRVIPQSNFGNALFAVGLVSLLSLLAAIFSIYVLKGYGWGLFVGIPFFLGFGATLLYGYHQQRTYKESMLIALSSVMLFGLLLLVLAIEGFICILMAAPIGIFFAIAGAAVAYPIQKRNIKNTHALLSVFIFIPGMALLENVENPKPALVSVTTEIIVNQPPQIVWDNLVDFNEMKTPAELIFKAGIAYPVKAVIKGRGVGAVRNCVFTTGAFVEPIEVWDEPKLLKFSVAAMPPPMTEISFYEKLNIPHLDGYFVSEKGQFVLTAIGFNKTKLQGTTWYRHNIWPGAYWKLWSDFILHKIHLRVLNHIKSKAETRL